MDRARVSAADVSISEAAALTGLARITIRRYVERGRLPNAYKDTESGAVPAPWRIPVSDFEEANLLGRSVSDRAPTDNRLTPRESPPKGGTREEERLNAIIDALLELLALHRLTPREGVSLSVGPEVDGIDSRRACHSDGSTAEASDSCPASTSSS